MAKKIAEEVVNAELQAEEEYDEEDAKMWSLTIGDKVRDAIKSKLRTRISAEVILICIKRSENMNIPRYKIIVQTTVGQLRDQGIRVASRCLWDVSTDNYTSVTFKNVSEISL